VLSLILIIVLSIQYGLLPPELEPKIFVEYEIDFGTQIRFINLYVKNKIDIGIQIRSINCRIKNETKMKLK